MEPITGFISTTEELDSVVPVAPHDAYFNAAKPLMPGVQLLAGVLPSGSAAALTLLSGHILECLLKAFLSNVGVTEKELREKPLGHDLSTLWRRAAEKGLAIGSMPDWAETITKLHDAPYPLRYLNVKVQNEQNK